VNKKVQSVNIDLAMVAKLYSSLNEYLNTIRDQFDDFKKCAIDLGGCSSYQQEKKNKKRKV